MKICLVGAGGIGSRMAGFMNAMLPEIDILHVMDGDVFEEKNLERQIFGRDMIGMSKARAMHKLHPRFIPVPVYLHYSSQLDKYDMIVCVPDNNACRLLAINHCLENGKIGIIAGNETTSANAYVVHGELVRDVPGMNPLVRYPEIETNPGTHAGSCAQASEDRPQTALANASAACMAMNLLLYWRNIANELPLDILMEYAPVEMIWTESCIKTLKTGDMK